MKAPAAPIHNSANVLPSQTIQLPLDLPPASSHCGFCEAWVDSAWDCAVATGES
jgi:hypothetical protein